ncbi:phosphoenolpyruvate synthase [Rubrobacter tropicus]|uniref:Phosphoenolpyruvate synthase n=1 Tax=Rubrobacter tropicus TaxID=2653851 RepID=A0A6G8QDW9_9ACTN|nr:PEP/pyruvate-binding domain-containing protein [Rubrobacter tropicus]QIN84700.1 phosphoenolpyruvate synthase [Rubrobacter tropicus]
MTYTLRLDRIHKEDIALAGGKGANLGELGRAGLPVPPGFVITTRAYDAFADAGGLGDETLVLASRADSPAAFETAAERIHALFDRAGIPEGVEAEIRDAYERLGEDGQAPVAVRSSATAEDLPGASFAGQQETYLNVRGPKPLMDAVRGCWASLWTARAMAYRQKQRIDPSSVSLAVVVQRMVDADAAGILFTADPVTGRRDRIVISATWGLGEAVVGGKVTPDTLVVDGSSGRVVSRETADKQVMTVYTDDGTAEKPVPDARRLEPVIGDGEAAELARYGTRIENLYGTPQDIEWALSGGRFFVLQARPITALPAERMEPPSDWTVPDPKGFYSRNSIVELLPDPLSPLFASLAADPVAQTLQRVFDELLGENVFAEKGIEFVTINGYAYYYMRITPRVAWRMTRVIPGAMREMVFRQSGERLWRKEYRPRYAGAVEERAAKSPEELPATRLLSGVEELLYSGAEYYTSVQMVLPAAYVGEALFAWFYDRLIKRGGDPPSQAFLLGFDSAPIRADKSLYDLAEWCRNRPALAAALMDTPSESAPGLTEMVLPPSGVDDAAWREWRSRFGRHLDRYGRMVYDLDFAKPVPADDPGPTFDTLKYYLRGEGRNPHERQRDAVRQRERHTGEAISRLGGVRLRVFRGLLSWTQKYAPLREDALADVGLAWPLMREMLLELGRRLVAASAIEKPDDVFWLDGDELRGLAVALDEGQRRLEDRSEVVRGRRARWRAQKLVTPPNLLPEGRRFMGLDMERWMPARSGEQDGNVIEGVGASPGTVTARARLLEGPDDFGEIEPGEVLVAGITTPAWTPLFAVASAVVTDIGGPLSHGSIVAREYGIPAVLGTGAATKRISSGQSVRVDGDAGTVTLLDGTDEDEAGRPSPEIAARTRGALTPWRIPLSILAIGVAAIVWWRARKRS